MVTDAHVWTAGRSETLQYLDETPRRDELTTSPSHPSAIRRLAIACACAVFTVVLFAAQAAQASAPLRYVALGDSYSAASGVLPLDLTARPVPAVDPQLPPRDRGRPGRSSPT